MNNFSWGVTGSWGVRGLKLNSGAPILWILHNTGVGRVIIILVLWYIFLKSSRIFWERSGESALPNPSWKLIDSNWFWLDSFNKNMDCSKVQVYSNPDFSYNSLAEPVISHVFNGIEKSTNIQMEKSAKWEQYTILHMALILTFWCVNPL